ncbi:hypothetical protein CL617_02360 [archaeon]|nr:hypothetical protein [archaeon]|tara:strand:+ start:16501 stop:16875 length:375 start_codon:yes stop_codon:yes gene_type:complete
MEKGDSVQTYERWYQKIFPLCVFVFTLYGVSSFLSDQITHYLATNELTKLKSESALERFEYVNEDNLVDRIRKTIAHETFPIYKYVVVDSVDYGMYIDGEFKFISEPLYKKIQKEIGKNKLKQQ